MKPVFHSRPDSSIFFEESASASILDPEERKNEGDEIMDEILLIGQDACETAKVRNLLRDHISSHLIRQAHPDRMAISQQFSARTTMAIFNYDRTLQNTSASGYIRHLGFSQPIVILSHVAQRSVVADLGAEKDVVLLEKPYTPSDLVGLTQKVLRGEETRQRLCPRFDMCETVGLEAFGVSGKIAATMNKISRKGAQLKLEGFSRLTMGDLIQIHVRLKNLDRYHIVPAQIMSCEDGEKIQPGENFGVAWLTQAAVKKIA